MNKLIHVALINFLTAACMPEYIPKTNNIIVIGDSLCEATHNSYGGEPYPMIAGFDIDCVGGRRSVEYSDQLPDVSVIIWSHGSNDAGVTDIQEFRDDMIVKFDSTTAEIYCVLPDNEKEGFYEVRAAMFEICANTIEPREHGYNFSALDGIHGTALDHSTFGEWLKDFFKKEGFE